MKVKLSKRGWVTIPASLRKKYGLKPGANLQVVDYGGVLAIVPAIRDPAKRGARILKGEDSLTRAVIAEHPQERRRGK